MGYFFYKMNTLRFLEMKSFPKPLFCTEGSRLVQVFGPQQTALLENPH